MAVSLSWWHGECLNIAPWEILGAGFHCFHSLRWRPLKVADQAKSPLRVATEARQGTAEARAPVRAVEAGLSADRAVHPVAARASAPAAAPVQVEGRAGVMDPVESQRRAERLAPMRGVDRAGRAQVAEPPEWPEWMDETRVKDARAVSPNPAIRVL
jgi:hypothetical protein